MSSTDLETLPNELQIIIMKYLSIGDRYLSLFGLNSRYDELLGCTIPSKINEKYLESDINDVSRYSHKKIKPDWNPTKLFYLIPTFAHRTTLGWLDDGILQLQWKFISEKNFPRYIQQQQNVDPRLFEISSKYPVQLNSLFFRSYDFHWKTRDMLNFPVFLVWIYENYSKQCTMLQQYCEQMMNQSYYYNNHNEPRRRTFVQIQNFEVKRQTPIIYQQAQKIWTELKTLGDFNYSVL
ncbi:unnamed protein product [Adineta ricciae]|uniref:Uncharacterized protein n=1 Tax=Adineta ricciae TaxID=249248 RepID=A0A815HDQ0_ADIRI|nr:unnamed protein product [Adineta ricciae]CAF1393204.1 unnamed protein product [Adineta ricciae]